MSVQTTQTLSAFLAETVPVKIEQIEAQSGPTLNDYVNLGPFAEILGSKGDVLLFGGGKPMLQQELADQLAYAIAVMSYIPGGITLFNMKFETKSN